MHTHRLSVLCFMIRLAPCLLVGGGCSSIPLDSQGTMVAVYEYGQFRMLLNADAVSGKAAVEQAFGQMGWFKVHDVTRRFAVELSARTGKDDKVVVLLREINSRQSEITIRVNKNGDKGISRQLYDRVELNLRSP